MKAPNFLHPVEEGDHSLRVTKRGLQAGGETPDDIDQRILGAINEFVGSLVGSTPKQALQRRT
jgi:hypothetical protein